MLKQRDLKRTKVYNSHPFDTKLEEQGVIQSNYKYIL